METVKNPGATDASQQKKPPNTTVRLSGNRAIPVKNAIDLSAIEDGTIYTGLILVIVVSHMKLSSNLSTLGIKISILILTLQAQTRAQL